MRRQSTTEEILIARGFRRESTTEDMQRCRNFRRQTEVCNCYLDTYLLFSSAELHISEQNDLAEPSGARGEAHGEHPQSANIPSWQHSPSRDKLPLFL